jgi:LmbE family N-acetylglucosaminyl deacetylase
MKHDKRLAPLACGLLLLGLAARATASEDDTYKFAAGASEEHSLTAAPAQDGSVWTWAWPHATAAWDTALLGMRVNAGDEALPWVEISTPGATDHVQQYLDPKASGLRWLNLTRLASGLKDNASVELRGHGVRFEAGPATLRLFASHLDLNQRILILAPHPDDAEIAAFGTYAGRNVTIVTVTSGNAGDANYKDDFKDSAEQYQFKGFLRAVDSVTVPWQGGISPEHCFNLGYFDARLATMYAKPDAVVPEMYGPNTDVSVYRRANISHLLPTTPRQSSWNNLVADLVTVLTKLQPQIILMPHPQLDGHSDHDFVSVAASQALERWKGPATFLLYTNHTGHNLFPYGPPGTTMSIPPWPGDPIAVERVYSHPVSAELQRRKLYALETMHDLRLSPTEQAACDTPGAPRRDDYPRVPSTDYFRRGPRAEETFFVYGRDGVRDVIRTFLGADRSK